MTIEEKTANGDELNEGAKEVDLTKYVGKEDHDKALTGKDTEITKVKEELDQAKMSLLDPEYIEYLESKKTTPAKDAATDTDASEQGLPSKSEFADLKKELGMVKAATQDVLAVIELKNTEERYADFKDYKDEVKAILESSRAPLTFEQAYKIAKSSRPPKDGENTADPTKETVGEKPSGSVPGDGLEKTEFKDAKEAGDDAWDKAVGPGKDRL